MTGLYPHVLDKEFEDRGQAGAFIGSAFHTLAERLAAGGYDTAGFVSNLYLKQENGFGQGFRHFDDRSGMFWWGPKGRWKRAEHVVEPALAWLERAESPFFLWVHVMDPHHPYEPASAGPWEDGSRAAPHAAAYGALSIRGYTQRLKDLRAGRPRATPEELAYLVGRYDAEILQVDRELARLHQRLESRGFDERNTVLIVTADHGEEVLDHGGMPHGHSLFDELIRVPLGTRGPESPAPPEDRSLAPGRGSARAAEPRGKRRRLPPHPVCLAARPPPGPSAAAGRVQRGTGTEPPWPKGLASARLRAVRGCSCQRPRVFGTRPRIHVVGARPLPDARPLPPAAGAVLLDAARRPRHGRARGLRPERPDGHGHPAARPEQAQLYPQPEGVRGPRDLPSPRARGRRGARGGAPRRGGTARRRLRDAAGAEPAPRLLLDLRLRAGRPVPGPCRARRQLPRLRGRHRPHGDGRRGAGDPGRADRRHRRRGAHGGGRHPRRPLGAGGDGARTVRRHRDDGRRRRLAGGERLPSPARRAGAGARRHHAHRSSSLLRDLRDARRPPRDGRGPRAALLADALRAARPRGVRRPAVRRGVRARGDVRALPREVPRAVDGRMGGPARGPGHLLRPGGDPGRDDARSPGAPPRHGGRDGRRSRRPPDDARQPDQALRHAARAAAARAGARPAHGRGAGRARLLARPHRGLARARGNLTWRASWPPAPPCRATGFRAS